jgi:hypothetical protein
MKKDFSGRVEGLTLELRLVKPSLFFLRKELLLKLKRQRMEASRVSLDCKISQLD